MGAVIKLNLFESLDLCTLCVSLNGDKVHLRGLLSYACSISSESPHSGVMVVFFVDRAPWSVGAARTALQWPCTVICATLFSQIQQDGFANVSMSKGHLSHLYSQLMAGLDSHS